MHKNNPLNNHHHHRKPPHPPPLSISLPSPTRPEIKPEPELDSFPHSPLQSSSSRRSDDPEPEPEPTSKNDTALVVVENYYSPLTSPLPLTPPNTTTPTSTAAADAIPLSPTPQTMLQFSRREEAPTQSGVLHGVGEEGGGGGERKKREVRWRKKEVGVGAGVGGGGVVERVGLGIRVLEIVFCLISFSVMASDKTQGWSGDSFDRYKEYRFCLTMAIFGFVYSAFQAYDLGSYLATGKHVIKHRFRYQFDFIMDQILAYLLISASSAAASRVDDWQANWGKDEFTAKASGSISMAFLAFICFAVSSIISGYNLCNPDTY